MRCYVCICAGASRPVQRSVVETALKNWGFAKWDHRFLMDSHTKATFKACMLRVDSDERWKHSLPDVSNRADRKSYNISQSHRFPNFGTWWQCLITEFHVQISWLEYKNQKLKYNFERIGRYPTNVQRIKSAEGTLEEEKALLGGGIIRYIIPGPLGPQRP